MQSTGQIINDLIILGIFIYMSLVVSGKLKLKGEKQEKLESLLQRKGGLVKALVYGGTGVFVLILALHAFRDDLQSDKFISKQKSFVQWTDEHKKKMTEACIKNAVNSYAKDPVGTTEICECATEKLASMYTHEEAMKIDKMSEEEMIPIMLPILKACLADTTAE